MWILEFKGTYHEVHLCHYKDGSAVFVYTICILDIALTLKEQGLVLLKNSTW